MVLQNPETPPRSLGLLPSSFNATLIQGMIGGLLGGSWVVTSGVISIVTLLLTLLIEPPSKLMLTTLQPKGFVKLFLTRRHLATGEPQETLFRQTLRALKP